MPTTYQRRPAPCSHCGDVVLIAEHRLGKVLGSRGGKKRTSSLEHADPGPDGELFDEVDGGCRREPVDG